MNNTYYEVRRKDNGKVINTFTSESKAMGWFHKQYPYSFNTSLAVGDYNLFKVDTNGNETKVVPFYF